MNKVCELLSQSDEATPRHSKTSISYKIDRQRNAIILKNKIEKRRYKKRQINELKILW